MVKKVLTLMVEDQTEMMEKVLQQTSGVLTAETPLLNLILQELIVSDALATQMIKELTLQHSVTAEIAIRRQTENINSIEQTPKNIKEPRRNEKDYELHSTRMLPIPRKYSNPRL